MSPVIVPPAPLSEARKKFLTAVLALEDQVVIMGALDCSETVAIGVRAASDGKLKQSDTHRAQTYHDQTRKLGPDEQLIPGDLGFFGVDEKSIVHVIVYIAPGKVLSADGATSRIKSVDEAKLARARVRFHKDPNYRGDVPFQGWHRNDIVDSIAFVTL